MSTQLHQRTYIILLLCLVLVSCKGNNDGLPPTLTPTQIEGFPTSTLVATKTSPPEATPTSSQPPLVVLLSSSDTPSSQFEELATTLTDLAQMDGLQINILTSLSTKDFSPNLRLVVTTAPDPGIENLAAAAPNIQFLGIGISGIKASDNLSLIGPDGARPDEVGFLAGYLAAAITPEWRVGVINLSDSSDDVASRDGFLNGAIYFCGLCQPTYPPFITYPLYIELPSGSSQAEWLSLTSVLQEKSVKTVYISPGAIDEALLNSLAEAGINLIGSVSPPTAIHSHWAASIYTDAIPTLKEIWPQLINGNGNITRPMSLSIGDINPELVSPGRLHLVEDMLKDLEDGFIDTGVQPTLIEGGGTSP
jgi:hypothetical protein